MISPDTNVLVTYLARQRDPGFPGAAASIAKNYVLITPTVLLETEWVLRSAFRLEKADIIEKLRWLIALPNVEVGSDDAVNRALEWSQNGLDLADAFHLASTPSDARFVTADRSLVHKARRIPGAPRIDLLQDTAS
jgi:predicted nucleic acid-binding protein